MLRITLGILIMIIAAGADYSTALSTMIIMGIVGAVFIGWGALDDNSSLGRL